MSTMQRQSILRCVCCTPTECFAWGVYDRSLAETRTNPYTSQTWNYYGGILLSGGEDWPGLADSTGTPGEGKQHRTGCSRLIVWRNRELQGTSVSDMHFAAGSEDHILKAYRGGPGNGPFYAPGDATKTPITTKPNYFPCLNLAGVGTATAWVKPTLSDIHDYLKGDQGEQGAAPWWSLDPTYLRLGAIYDVMATLFFYKRALSWTTSGGGARTYTYQDEEDGYAFVTSVGVELVSY